MSQIPFKRQLLYLFLFFLLLPTLVFFQFLGKKSTLNHLENQLSYVEQAAFSKETKQAQNRQVVTHFQGQDPYYIDKHIESLTFLEEEKQSLQKVVESKNFAGDEAVKRRLSFLQGKENRPIFTETRVETYPHFKETERALRHPVQMNTDDLKRVLSLIEGVEIGNFEPKEGRPQMIVLDFQLEKKEILEENEIFQLHLKLLTREYN